MYQDEKGDLAKLDSLLNKDNKGINEATGILSRLFRLILADLSVIPMRWKRLMNNYLDDPVNRVPKNSKGRSSERGNLTKQLLHPNMSWKNFEKAIRFLGPKSAEFTIKLHWDNKTTVHRLYMGDRPIDEKDKEVDE